MTSSGSSTSTQAGNPVRIISLREGDKAETKEVRLGPFADGGLPFFTVPGNVWFAAVPDGEQKVTFTLDLKEMFRNVVTEL